jgi:hypothetical protein
MKVSEVVEALASKYSFNAEEALDFIRKKKQPKLRILEEAPKLVSIMRSRESVSRERSVHRVSFEYGIKWDDVELEEYQAPQETVETNEKFPLLLCKK